MNINARALEQFAIGKKQIGRGAPVYFIADIAANHDGDLQRAKALIYLAAEAGADAAKFQHFKARTIVSDQGFKELGNQKSHQSKWNKSVFQVYQDASVPDDWTPELKATCDNAGIDFFTSPYDLALVDQVDPYVPAFKIGSGDITWIEMVCHIARKQKPVILATGASRLDDVIRAVDAAVAINPALALMQCNTNYTAEIENLRYVNLNVLKVYGAMYPRMPLGLSDHTPGHVTVLGAIALGAVVVEKHFTDDNTRAGPDHIFSMTPSAWREMVLRSRDLEAALGSGIKIVEPNEEETVVLQRRALRLKRAVSQGTVLEREDLIALRPCPSDGLRPYDIERIVGKQATRDLAEGTCLRWSDLK